MIKYVLCAVFLITGLSLLLMFNHTESPSYNRVEIDFYLRRKPYIKINVDDEQYFSSFSTLTMCPLVIISDLSDQKNPQNIKTVKFGSKTINNPNIVILKKSSETTDAPFRYQTKLKANMGLFEEDFIVIDYSKDCIVTSSSEEGIVLSGYDVESWLKIPFTINEFGVLQVLVELNGNPLAMNLDTFAQTNCISSSLVSDEDEVEGIFGPSIPAKTLKIGSVYFDTEYFSVEHNLSEKIAGGVLGAPFFIDHSVCFDLKNQLVFISSEKKHLI
ncbi:hypothetical protein N9Y92_01070 [Chlamydiales bacterium]|nr:hypothetical protein [Chlamydiales bacterium]